MDVATIRERYYAKPFQPFVLRLNDGRQVHVRAPESMMISSDEQQVLVVQRDSELDIVDLPTIQQLEVVENEDGCSRNDQNDNKLSIADLRRFIDAKPFQPFVIRLKDDREIAVHERRCIFTGFRGWSITVTQPGSDGVKFGLEYIEEIRTLTAPHESGTKL